MIVADHQSLAGLSLREIAGRPIRRLLHVGCGAALEWQSREHESPEEIVGVERSPSKAAFAEEIIGHVVVGDAEHLPL